MLKLDTFLGKRKVKDRSDNVEYEVICQVMTDMPTYEVHDKGGNVKVIHQN